jgi:hypothetical protein
VVGMVMSSDYVTQQDAQQAGAKYAFTMKNVKGKDVIWIDVSSDSNKMSWYKLQFEGTGKYQKVSDGEKIIFTDTKTGKEYEFNADDVQKNGSSPFYMNLDVLRRYYDIRFDD